MSIGRVRHKRNANVTRHLDANDGHLDKVDDDQPRQIVRPDEGHIAGGELLDDEAAAVEKDEVDEYLRDAGREEQLPGRLGEERPALGAGVEDENRRRVGDLKEHATLLVLEVAHETAQQMGGRVRKACWLS